VASPRAFENVGNTSLVGCRPSTVVAELDLPKVVEFILWTIIQQTKVFSSFDTASPSRDGTKLERPVVKLYKNIKTS